MRQAIFRARHVVVVAPHPDDETIAAWGLMRQLQKAGAKIAILVVTDGSASHPGSLSWPFEQLVAARRRETVRAMRVVGISPAAVRFLSLPDGGLDREPGCLLTALRRGLERRRWPDLLVGPEVTDAHADHRAVAKALTAIPRRGERRMTYHVWPEGAARGARTCRIVLDGMARSLKRRIIRSYRTQAGLITDSPTGFTMTHRQLKAFVSPQERFAVCA